MHPWVSCVTKNFVRNFADLNLMKTRKEILSLGSKFTLIPKHSDQSQTEAQFENLYVRVKNLIPISDDKARLFGVKSLNMYDMFGWAPVRQQLSLTGGQ